LKEFKWKKLKQENGEEEEENENKVVIWEKWF